MTISEMTDLQFCQALRKCIEIDGCTEYERFHDGCGVDALLTEAAERIEELAEIVKQKNQCFTENGKIPGEKQEPTKTTEYISIKLEEYAYLRNLGVLMDILLGDGDYNTFRNVVAVRQSIRELKESRRVAAQE